MRPIAMPETPRPKTLRAPLALLLLPLLAACAAPAADGQGDRPFPGLFGSAPDEPPAPEPLPAAVQAALPPGVPSSVVLQDSAGCYLYSIERTDPPSGYPLRDGAGNPICENSLPPVLAADGAPIDIAPVLSAPLPNATVATSAPLPPGGGFDPTPPLGAPTPTPPVSDTTDLAADPVADPVTVPPGAFAPGDITPPAPIAPLN